MPDPEKVENPTNKAVVEPSKGDASNSALDSFLDAIQESRLGRLIDSQTVRPAAAEGAYHDFSIQR